MRARPLLLLSLAMLARATIVPVAGAQEDGPPPRVEEIEPQRHGDLLTCHVRTSNLPGARISSSIRSGLPSSIEMDVEVFDENGDVIAGNRVSYRIAFDLWEEFFQVTGGGDEQRFDALATLESYLADFPRIPVAPISALHPDDRLRIRVGLHLHPIAPAETDRLGDWAAGDEPSDRYDPEGSRAFVSFGKIIRYFYRGARDGAPSEVERTSEWFRIANLTVGSDPAETDVPAGAQP